MEAGCCGQGGAGAQLAASKWSRQAAASGKLAVLEWLTLHEYTLIKADPEPCVTAADHGRLAALKYLHEVSRARQPKNRRVDRARSHRLDGAARASPFTSYRC